MDHSTRVINKNTFEERKGASCGPKREVLSRVGAFEEMLMAQNLGGPDTALRPGTHTLSERTQGFTAGPVYGRAECLPMLGVFKT